MKIYIGGSRKLKPSAALKQVVKSILAGGNQITVGCATGADQQVIEACQSSISQCHVHAAFSENGNGSHSGSAVATVQAFCRAGGRVSWLAGGSLAVPLVARLMSRSLAGLRSANRAIFFEPGAGSLKVARAALKMSLPGHDHPLCYVNTANPASRRQKSPDQASHAGIINQPRKQIYFSFYCGAFPQPHKGVSQK